MAPASEPVDAIVMGGGVSGLAAARELSRSGLRIILIEARERMGGRVYTLRRRSGAAPVEMGAEFVHGGNADLWRLLRSAGVRPRTLPERHWLAQCGVATRIAGLDKKLGSVTRLIEPAKAGSLSFAGYFRRYPPGVDAERWRLARGFVEGFEAAPMDRISAKSLAGEATDDRHQYVVPGGYDRVVSRLIEDCARRGVRMLSRLVARSVAWREGRVTVTARDGLTDTNREYSARAAVVALPLGVLKARSGTGAVRFRPDPKGRRAAIEAMQVGHVVRLSIRFRRQSLTRLLPGNLRLGFGFIHSNVKGVPVWWSLSPDPVLVGWAGGPAAKALLMLPPSSRVRRAVGSLAEILGVSPARVRAAIVACDTRDWSHDPFSRGAYSFTAAGHDDAGGELGRPLKGTLFFAGEATAEGSEVGTVHGAISSGIRAGRQAAKALGRRRRLKV